MIREITSKETLSCIDKLSKKLSKIKTSFQEVPQEVMVDTFFKFNKLDQLNNIINERLGYYQKNSFLKLVIFGFVPISQDQGSLIHNLRYDMSTIHQINPGYFYLVESLDKQNEYILIHLDNNTKFLFHEGYLRKVKNFDELISYGQMDGSSRIIRFKYTSDYIQVFRDLELLLKLDLIRECDELVDLVKIFVRTFNRRLDNYASISQLIPGLFIQNQPIETKFKGTSKRWLTLSELDSSKYKYNYKDIIKFFNNFGLHLEQDRRISKYLIEEEISKIFEFIPSNTPIQDILDKARSHVILACAILDQSPKSPSEHKINKSYNTFREYSSILFLYDGAVSRVRDSLLNMLEIFFRTDTLIYREGEPSVSAAFYSDYTESYNPDDVMVDTVRFSNLCRFEPYLIAYKIAKNDDLLDQYLEYMNGSRVVFRDLEYERIDGDLEFILNFFKYYLDRNEKFIDTSLELSENTNTRQQYSFNLKQVYDMNIDKKSPVHKFNKSKIVSTIVESYINRNSLLNDIERYYGPNNLIYSVFMVHVLAEDITFKTNRTINYKVNGRLI